MTRQLVRVRAYKLESEFDVYASVDIDGTTHIEEQQISEEDARYLMEADLVIVVPSQTNVQ